MSEDKVNEEDEIIKEQMKYNRESHCTTQKEMKVRPHVDLFDIKNPRL